MDPGDGTEVDLALLSFEDLEGVVGGLDLDGLALDGAAAPSRGGLDAIAAMLF